MSFLGFTFGVSVVIGNTGGGSFVATGVLVLGIIFTNPIEHSTVKVPIAPK